MLDRTRFVNKKYMNTVYLCIAIETPMFYNAPAAISHFKEPGMDDQIDSPAELLDRLLTAKGWTQKQLAEIMGKPTQLINEIAKRKRSVTPETAVLLAAALGNDAKEWLVADAVFQLNDIQTKTADVSIRAKLHSLAPIAEMAKRGWIESSDDPIVLETQLKTFFSVSSLDEEIEIGCLTRRSAEDGSPLNRSQRAWCFRVRQRARNQLARHYNENKIDECLSKLRAISICPPEYHRIPTVLNDYGIRFVVVEPLINCKVDGVAMWIDDAPAIGMSILHDRVDSFFHTLCHGISHIKHRDEAPLDSDIRAHAMLPMTVKPAIELRADREAAAALIAPQELESFVQRVGPLYSKDTITGFSRRIKIHAGIVVGQLQFRGEIGYYANREMLVKVRSAITSTALTDGYGYSN